MGQKDELRVSVWIILYKFFLGLGELILGLGILIFGKQLLAEYFLKLSQELSEDPHDLIAHLSLSVVPNFFSHNTIIVITLILLGLTKIAGSVGLVYKKHWGVDLLVGLTIVMLPFQMINIVAHRSISDFLFLVFGVAIALYLIQFKPKEWADRVFQKN